MEDISDLELVAKAMALPPIPSPLPINSSQNQTSHPATIRSTNPPEIPKPSDIQKTVSTPPIPPKCTTRREVLGQVESQEGNPTKVDISTTAGISSPAARERQNGMIVLQQEVDERKNGVENDNGVDSIHIDSKDENEEFQKRLSNEEIDIDIDKLTLEDRKVLEPLLSPFNLDDIGNIRQLLGFGEGQLEGDDLNRSLQETERGDENEDFEISGLDAENGSNGGEEDFQRLLMLMEAAEVAAGTIENKLDGLLEVLRGEERVLAENMTVREDGRS
ncbi:hypothetical protein M231_07461 [Tremella mesenterica]|uniref:Uncharacterized protein n=1 Tax=Tremella mesenterica TaxID=5217 RepID=A0A4V1M315_TREME|nr:uncharacterized protein TREMEDRAFT_62406 [Tremella mesenterica DSM 1558]EIW69545.1 hypothetical protein TREMEDRAFT_62406 [Tremella mesenterica DSM 1558]RXK35290.1 hypothetical protein M231_07461 [Tremella mesenterica]